MNLSRRLLEVFDLDPLTGAFREPLLDLCGKPFEFRNTPASVTSRTETAPVPEQAPVSACNGKGA